MTNVNGIIRSTCLTIWLIVALAISTELSAPFKAFLTGFTGQHWATKSVLALIAFVVFYVLFRKSAKPRHVLTETFAVVLSVVLGGSAIFAFYVWHFLAA